jgi:hypothetical protein
MSDILAGNGHGRPASKPPTLSCCISREPRSQPAADACRNPAATMNLRDI